MLFRTELSIRFVLALAFTHFFFNIRTTDALKCISCHDTAIDPNSCNNPRPGDTGVEVMTCAKDDHKDVIPVCIKHEIITTDGKSLINRFCSTHGKGEYGKCLDDKNFPGKSGCVTMSQKEYDSTHEIKAFCRDKHINKKIGGSVGKLSGAMGRSGETIKHCSCTSDFCNAENWVPVKPVQPEEPDDPHAPHPNDPIVLLGGSSIRGSEGVIFSLTLLIQLHLHATSALWH